MMRWLVPCAAMLLTGCVSEDEQTLRSWRGVYETTRISENDVDCDEEGADLALDPPFFELDAAVGETAHLVELRNCDSKKSCDPFGFVTAITPVANDKKIKGVFDDWLWSTFATSIGACSIFHMDFEVTRDGPDAKSIRAEIRTTVADSVEIVSEDECVAWLEDLADDEQACTNLTVVEGRRVD